MFQDLILSALAAGVPGQELPPMATLGDQLFAYGTVVLLVVMVVWHHGSDSDPPRK